MMLRILLRIPIFCLLFTLTTVSGHTRLRGKADSTNIRDGARRTASNSGLSKLSHFGLDPDDFIVAGGGVDASEATTTTATSEAITTAATFEPCADVRMCLPLSFIIAEIDDAILQRHVECQSVEDCLQGECRYIPNVGLKCDAPGKLYCGYDCVEDNTAGDILIP